MMGAGSLKCLLFRVPWPTGRVVRRPYPKSKLWCFGFSPIASKTAKTRLSLTLFSLSRREQVWSTPTHCVTTAGQAGDREQESVKKSGGKQLGAMVNQHESFCF